MHSDLFFFFEQTTLCEEPQATYGAILPTNNFNASKLDDD